MYETANRRVGRDPAGVDRLSLFITQKNSLGGFLRARTLPQKIPVTERICQLVFSRVGVATIGRCVSSLIHFKDDKKMSGAFLNSVLASRGHPWSKKPGRY